VSLAFHLTVANLLLMITFELNLGGLHLTWGFHDALRDEVEKEHERRRFYRPTEATPPMEIDERYRKFQA